MNIDFSVNVSDFTLDDIEVTKGTAGNFAGADASYTVEVTPRDDFHGSVTVTVPAGVAVDTNDDTNVEGRKRFAVNTTTSPTLTIESWDDFPAHGAF